MQPDAQLIFSRPLSAVEKANVESKMAAFGKTKTQIIISLCIGVPCLLFLARVASADSAFLQTTQGATFSTVVILIFLANLLFFVILLRRWGGLASLKKDLAGIYRVQGQISFPTTTSFKVGNHSFSGTDFNLADFHVGDMVFVEFTSGTHHVYALDKLPLPVTPPVA